VSAITTFKTRGLQCKKKVHFQKHTAAIEWDLLARQLCKKPRPSTAQLVAAVLVVVVVAGGV
jgi:hypothetical protein